jgi:hypothetical protein
MRSSRILMSAVLAAAAIAATWSGARAAEDAQTRFLLGTDLGVSIYHPTNGGDNLTVVSWPQNIVEEVPSLRIGALLGPSMAHEVYAKTGFVDESRGGGSVHILALTGNYQYTFPAEGGASPYLTAGGGLLDAGSSGGSSTSGVFGGGVGVRYPVAERHGALHFEARFDRIGESDRVRPMNVFSFLFGFELWM